MKSSTKSKVSDLGGKGEDAAIAYLKKKGYRIIECNFRTKFGEIDIIAKDPEGVLVFVEVKTLSGILNPARGLIPEDNLSSWKLYKLQRICQFFANAHPALVGEEGWRIDLVAVVLGAESYKLKHYKNL